MRCIKKLTIAILLCCISLIYISPPINASDNRTYRIATVAWTGWSPLHVAREKGFWDERGIDVEVINYDDPIIILEAIKAGRIDFAMDMVGSLVGIYMRGTPVIALAETNWSHGGDKIIVKAGHTIIRHKGSPLGVFLDLPSCNYFLGCYLETQDLKLTDFRIVELHPDALTAQFIAGRIPVIVNYDPWALKAIEMGNGTALASSADFEGCIPECIWGYKEHLKKIPPDDIKRVLKGWISAAQWVNNPENRGEYFRILNKHTFKDHAPYPDDTLKRMLNNVRIHTLSALKERNRNNGGLAQYLTSLRSFLEENALLEKDFTVADIFDNRLIMEVLDEERK